MKRSDPEICSIVLPRAMGVAAGPVGGNSVRSGYDNRTAQGDICRAVRRSLQAALVYGGGMLGQRIEKVHGRRETDSISTKGSI